MTNKVCSYSENVQEGKKGNIPGPPATGRVPVLPRQVLRGSFLVWESTHGTSSDQFNEILYKQDTDKIPHASILYCINGLVSIRI